MNQVVPFRQHWRLAANQIPVPLCVFEWDEQRLTIACGWSEVIRRAELVATAPGMASEYRSTDAQVFRVARAGQYKTNKLDEAAATVIEEARSLFSTMPVEPVLFSQYLPENSYIRSAVSFQARRQDIEFTNAAWMTSPDGTTSSLRTQRVEVPVRAFRDVDALVPLRADRSSANQAPPWFIDPEAGGVEQISRDLMDMPMRPTSIDDVSPVARTLGAAIALGLSWCLPELQPYEPDLDASMPRSIWRREREDYIRRSAAFAARHDAVARGLS